MLSAKNVASIQAAVRAGVAASLAVAVAKLLELQHPTYAMIAAVVVTDLAPSQSRALASTRLTGTALGAVIGALAVNILPQGPLTLGITILVAMVLCNLLFLPDAAKLAGFLCGVIVLDYNLQPWSYALYRFVETALGVGIALGLSLIPVLVRSDFFESKKSTAT